MAEKEIPVYLFTGFLESGKTKFIQETLEDERFNAGEKTLILMCEEGIEELDFSKYDSKNLFLEYIENEEDINDTVLTALMEKYNAERVIVEYNGMWMLDNLFASMPANWVVYQEFCFADANTYATYNQNMRQQVYDKLKSCDCIVFNRYTDTIDKMTLHKIVRGASRRTQIVYEREGGEAEVDEIEDPLPFDVNAPVIKIEDRDYAYWYRDLDESMDSYDGKVVSYKGITADSSKLPKGFFVLGRQLMTCCAADIQMAGLACEFNGPRPEPRKWVQIEAKIAIKKSEIYGGKKGPVMIVQKIEPAEEPEEEVTTFY